MCPLCYCYHATFHEAPEVADDHTQLCLRKRCALLTDLCVSDWSASFLYNMIFHNTTVHHIVVIALPQ